MDVSGACEANVAPEPTVELLQLGLNVQSEELKLQHEELYVHDQPAGTGLAFPSQLLTCNAGTAAVTTRCLSKQFYQKMLTDIEQVFLSLNTTCTVDSCPQAEWAGCILRVSGHDFMDLQKTSNGAFAGGADGCTDLSNPDNAGLKDCITESTFGPSLKQIYQGYCTQVSLADFFIIAAEAVIVATRNVELKLRPQATSIGFVFRYGRTTGATCPSSQGTLPDAEGGCPVVKSVFVDRLGLTWGQSAALMGVHTLGRAYQKNSGYNGWWKAPDDARRFNNNYFANMVGNSWTSQKSVGGNPLKNQWARVDAPKSAIAGAELMLNTDICLAFSDSAQFGPRKGAPVLSARDHCCTWMVKEVIPGAVASLNGTYCGKPANTIKPGDISTQFFRCCGTSAGALGDCDSVRTPTGPAATTVLAYANNETQWILDFQDIWKTVVELGVQGQLKDLADQCPQ